MSCQAYQNGDSTRCGPCGLQWDYDDPEPPPCMRVSTPAREVAKAVLRKQFELRAVAAGLSVTHRQGDEYMAQVTATAWVWYQAGVSAARKQSG